MTVPWLLVSFVGGSVFGAALTLTCLLMLLTETPVSVNETEDDDEWKY